MRGYVIPYFRGRKLGDIGPLDVKHFIDHLATVKPVSRRADVERLSKASIGSIMVPLKALLAEAHELELTRTDASKVRVVVQTDQAIKPPKAMTPDQTAAVLGAIPERDRLLFLFLSRTGLRIAEALGLQWQDFEQTDDGPVIAVRRQYYRGKLTEKTKTAAGKRHVAVLPSLAQALMRHRASSEFASAGDPMFPALNGAHQDDHNVRRRLRPAAEAAGVPWVTPHVFRDSLATQLRDAGYDADVIAKVLGHTDEAFTRRVYTHTRAVPRFDDLDLSIARKA
jgi:integrase